MANDLITKLGKQVAMALDIQFMGYEHNAYHDTHALAFRSDDCVFIHQLSKGITDYESYDNIVSILTLLVDKDIKQQLNAIP